MTSTVGPYHPSLAEEILPELPATIPDPEEERPTSDEVLPNTHLADGQHRDATISSPIILGCAVFGYGIYSSQEFVQGADPVRVIRYALRCGINAFDTSPWYHPSEIVLGRVFERLKDEYPRESYQIITKLGKYGPKVGHHTYDADSVRSSVERSLRRLRTGYLDVVYLHDVEFVSSHPFPCPGGNHLSALAALDDSTSPDDFKLRPPHTPHGAGDEQILEGLRALAVLRSEGKVRQIGIAGYPLPVLLRLSLLARSNGVTLDIVQTYAQQTILNPSLVGGYLAAFETAGVKQVTNAAPLAMGILTSSGGPEWHPARSESDGMYQACVDAAALCKERGTSIEQVALNFGYKEVRLGKGDEGGVVPVVIGCKNIDEIKRTIKQWREVNVSGVRDASATEKVEQVEDEVIKLFEQRGVKGVSWSSPGQGAL